VRAEDINLQMPGRRRRVLLAGATGYIGRAVAGELCARGHDVIAVVRDLAQARLPPACTPRVAELTEPEPAAAVLADSGVDAIVSCLASRTGVADDAWRVDYGANANLLSAAKAAGVERFVLLSAICVQKPRLEFQRAKLAFESGLAASGLDYTIVRPTAFFKSLAGQVTRVREGKPFLLFGDGTATACKPIGEADLARFLAGCLEDPDDRNRILPIGGPGPAVTPRRQGELLFELTGRPPRFRSVPPAMFTAAAGLLSPLGRVFPAAAAKAELARIGRYYATESMLVWNERTGGYDADATPEYGNETLEDFYRRVLAEGLAGQEAGDHKLF
jgi:divinyl chlorophyllide a 8-vinyl-reductase